MSFRNRCLIAGAQKVIALSVPLREGRNQQLPVSEVLIAENENWQSRHFKSLRSSYNRSPFFEHYQDELDALYKKPCRFLSEWNLLCLNWVGEKLNYPAEIRFTQTAVAFPGDGWDDRRNQVLPRNYSEWNPVQYRQVFEEKTGFLPNLSILDLLFNTGKEAGELLYHAMM